jgi:hypothetical protein
MSRYLKYDGMIAPCGMNCGLCIGHLREKNPCGGCLSNNDNNKPNVCRSCSVVICEYLAKTESGFCFDCPKYPCKRLCALDKRYSTKYGMSMFENLLFIKENGINSFLESEEEKWKCANCESGLSVHRDNCLNCGYKYR